MCRFSIAAVNSTASQRTVGHLQRRSDRLHVDSRVGHVSQHLIDLACET